ncbi:Cupredoxin [Aspergillus taichungensis]|uniref:laccase n=1 Tax=Aspergillus taichungensis TaxID=482145 RepID=A0A2J5I8P3_9EURO|nr:Cupredoxin [Aspergillus taichungensis]
MKRASLSRSDESSVSAVEGSDQGEQQPQPSSASIPILCGGDQEGCLGSIPTTLPGLPTRPPRGLPCPGNLPRDRSRWCNYDINTDYHNVVPNTGVTREYWFTIDEMEMAPDGVPRQVMAVNGSIPGPTIIGNWGDHFIIHVTNRLDQAQNGSSIHWHGIRQNYTSPHDGVVSITQCPTAPGSTTTYKWRAVQYGSSWWHSHIGLQAWNGVFGGILINGPASANYDVDTGLMFLSDWSHRTSDELFNYAQTEGPPTLDNGLINGTNVYETDDGEVGERFKLKMDHGRSYRLRLVNAAIDTHFRFMIDNHTLTVIGMDLVPIRPFETNAVSIGMGQRYDIIVTANQDTDSDSFWIRSIPQEACSENDSVENIKGILYYGAEPTEPTTEAWEFVDSCDDMPMDTLEPWVPKTVAEADWRNVTDVDFGFNANNLVRWYLNSTTMEVLWENPTLQQLHNGQTVFPNSSAVISLPDPDEWVYLIINTTFPVWHPIHLHGHDFYILAQGVNPWDGVVNTNNPPRRDTAMLDAMGYLVIAFRTDNPGAWLMHCHVGWHTSEGFALQFIERDREIQPLIDANLRELEDTCAAWVRYDEHYDIEQEDSGV